VHLVGWLGAFGWLVGPFGCLVGMLVGCVSTWNMRPPSIERLFFHPTFNKIALQLSGAFDHAESPSA
jgi:hypothetical protein